VSVRLTAASSEHLVRTTAPNYNAAYTFLIAFRATSISGGASIIGLRVNAANIDECFINTANGDRLYWRETNANATKDIVGSVVAVNTWYYVAMVRHSATSFQLYMGTTPTGMVSVGTNTAGNVASRAAATRVDVGSFATTSQFLDGRVRYARLFTSALSLAEIKEGIGSGLWGEWLLAAHTDVTDTSGNGRDLTAVNTPSTEADDSVTWPEADSDRRGQISWIELQVPDVAAVAPTAAFTVGINGFTATFTDTSTDDGSVTAWEWDFGDGSGVVTTQNASHTYNVTGTYTVTLTVTDNQGLQDAQQTSVTIGATANWAGPMGTGAFTRQLTADGDWVDALSPRQEDDIP
jgi:PKD repeat protein